MSPEVKIMIAKGILFIVATYLAFCGTVAFICFELKQMNSGNSVQYMILAVLAIYLFRVVIFKGLKRFG